MASIPVLNPATGETLADVPVMEAAEIERVIARARAAQLAWGQKTFKQRAQVLKTIARCMRDDPRFIDILTSESGKPHYEAEIFELFYTLDLTRFYTSRAGRRSLADDVRAPFMFPNKRARVVYHPRGVVSVIGPWNWPLLNNFADAIAPLLAGNAVILKPSERTPLTSLRIAELWREAGLPADVFQVVTGAVDAGRQLVDGTDMVFFTGSERAGRQIAQAAAARLIPCVLELGGKSAMIVLKDADVERAASAAVWSGFAHSGQVCIRTERVYVEEPIAERFTELCRQKTAALRHGNQGDALFDVGAMTFAPQMKRAEEQIADAVAQGARVLTGGKRDASRPGQFFEPTLIADATESMKVMHEETFGPLLPIMKVRDAEQALQLTNASPLGLSGSVWSGDSSRANALARRVESGSVCVNDVLFNYLCVEAPIGGVKASGLGIRHGAEALRQFCRVETVIEDHPILGFLSPTVAKLFGFPYRDNVRSLARRAMRLIY